MALQLEGISVVIPLTKIYEVYEGGEVAFWRDNHPSEHECDGELICMSFSNAIDAEEMIDYWKRCGLKPIRKHQGTIYWQDLCVVDIFNGPTHPCEWLEYDFVNHTATKKSKERKMTRIQLKFEGPFKISDFLCDPPIPASSENPGVYVWGFMQEHGFIPFYVGKIHTKISSRLKQHYKDIAKDDSTYLRLTKAYMEGPNPYYKDDNFPPETSSSNRKKLPGWAKRPNYEYFEERVVYMHNLEFLKRKYKGYAATENKRNYPINEPFGVEVYDYLKDNIAKMNVVYSPYSLNDFYGLEQEAFYEFMETFVKYSLKGKTGSQSWKFDTYEQRRKSYGFDFKIDNLDEYSNIFKREPSKEFLGY